MKDAIVQKLGEVYERLSRKGKDRVMQFIDLRCYCPGFNAELKAATPTGEIIPPLEVTEALMDKWETAQ